MIAYTKEFLIDAYISRFLPIIDIEALCVLEAQAIKLYNRVGKDEFRKYASLDAEAIKEYKRTLAS